MNNINEFLKKHFTEEEFNSIKGKQKGHGNALCKTLRVRKVYGGGRRMSPGGPDVDIFNDIHDCARLINDGILWYISEDNIENDVSERPRNIKNVVFYGVGDKYGELESPSESINKYLFGKLKVGDTLHNDFCIPKYIYLKEKKDDGFLVELWSYCCSDRHRSSFSAELVMTEKEILDNYFKR